MSAAQSRVGKGLRGGSNHGGVKGVNTAVFTYPLLPSRLRFYHTTTGYPVPDTVKIVPQFSAALPIQRVQSTRAGGMSGDEGRISEDAEVW